MPRKLIGGSVYNAAVKGAAEETRNINRLTEELAKPGVDNGHRHRLRAEILAALIRLNEHLQTLRDIGDEARQERRERG